ncbi:WhiB family transcriptional regulator [Streptomyces sp. NPDC006784]|uniref:WhiB family transcriptional regulator n=1 Tax=Streptomyces sp. NPDC006784 TaxID=3364764 RepID=UPI003674C863
MSITGHASDNLPRGDWREHAACRVLADPEVMFPPPGEQGFVARSICGDCPVRRACANWALSNPQDAAFGVWGGLTERERATILRRRVPRDPDHPQAECGTAAAVP